MTVIVSSKSTFDSVQLNNVSNIAYLNGTVTITAGGNTYTYTTDNYTVSLITN